jgi:hypothetical protein
MDTRVLANYLAHAELTEQQVHGELLKFKIAVTEGVIDRSYRKWIVYNKKRRDIENRKLKKGWAITLDFINQKIEGEKK